MYLSFLESLLCGQFSFRPEGTSGDAVRGGITIHLLSKYLLSGSMVSVGLTMVSKNQTQLSF